MADSSEKVSFLVDMQCSSLRAEAFLVFDKGSQPTLGQQITDSRPTNGQQSADCWQKIFVRAVNNSRPTVVQLSSHRTVGRLSSDCWPTVGQQSADSFLGELFFIFSHSFNCLTIFWTIYSSHNRLLCHSWVKTLRNGTSSNSGH